MFQIIFFLFILVATQTETLHCYFERHNNHYVWVETGIR
jgi:hypothetical protein